MEIFKIEDGPTYWLPADEQEVIELVRQAKNNNEIICVRGAAHSFPLINTLEKGRAEGRQYKYVMLSNMFAYKYMGNNTVYVQAGCHIGHDPWDPLKISTPENSLVYQLAHPSDPNQPELSIPDLGGITHQTVGGFLSTSSSGGSTKYSFEDALISVDIIHYNAGIGEVEKCTFKRPVHDDPTDPFYGAGVATMGLFGIIVSATFSCSRGFFIGGEERITTVDNCEIDLFGSGNGVKPSLKEYLKTTIYTRLIWWPQRNVNKMVVWKARQMTELEANKWAEQAYRKMGKMPPFPPVKKYEEVIYILNSPVLAVLASGVIFSFIGTWPKWLRDLLGNTTKYRFIKKNVEKNFYPHILPRLLDLIVPLDTVENRNKGPQQFSDTWYSGLPMDNQISDKLMPVWFTELWIPIDQSENVMKELYAFYTESDENTRAFSCEIYAAKKSRFWLSPAYGTDVIRIDIFWFGKNLCDPVLFFQKFWNLLSKYNFRPHWGKYLPDSLKIYPDPHDITGADYLKAVYPSQQWQAWMELREKMDAHQIFVNDYWRSHLGIKPV